LWAFIVFPILGALVGVVVWLAVSDARLEETMLANSATIAARDRADSLADKAVSAVEQLGDKND
jgi:hypothetical protein